METGERAFLEARRKAQRLDAEQIESHLARALSRAHWASLAPDLSIEGARPPGALEAHALAPETCDTLLRRLRVEGYFRTERFLSETAVGAMRRCVEALVAAGWPAVFAYVFDEFWQILRAPSLTALFASALGPGYRQSPRVWAHHVPAVKGAVGWPPHVDGGAATHTADRVTLWIPLSDATLDNGCMYLIPKDRVPPLADTFANNIAAIEPKRWRTMLQSSRAVPAEAGAILCWDFQVIHWSSPSDGVEAPRISLAVELLGERIEPSASEEPRFDPAVIPSFDDRLAAIARGILSYERFEPDKQRFIGFARKLRDAVELGGPRSSTRP